MSGLQKLRGKIPDSELAIFAAIGGDTELLEKLPVAELAPEVRELAVRLARDGGWSRSAEVLLGTPLWPAAQQSAYA